MKFIETKIKDLFIIEPKIWKDDRGYFFESYSESFFKNAGIDANFVQDNQSFSQRGTLRGLHAQANPHAQGKLVRVIQGKVVDVAVDVRKSSPTYGQHLAIELSGENQLMFWVPPGFLHGFVTLEDNTIFTYKVTNTYNKASEIGCIWNDPELNIDWGLPKEEIILSEKDKVLPTLQELNNPF
ncbi:MAG: dTDP-4-dehydrorhamnose 3,5-epimerase [Sphingobacteriales bacterium]|nr:dTDP-4-dehydrorhamnose 3,5-epimerase [Sphingobacteriales bacterium]